MHFSSYLKTEEEISNVLIYHQKQLADLIHSQMLTHQIDEDTSYEVKVSRGFTELKQTAATVISNTQEINFRNTDFDKSKINKIIFSGFEKCLYSRTKFASDTERRFAVVLEKESLKWFKPAKGQFQIFYRLGNLHQEYIPDFVAECNEVLLLIETKAKDEMTSEEVLNKKEAAFKWCEYATQHTKKYSGKPWKYLLIPHDEVKDNMTLQYYIGKF
ncbi:hypothetical protein [Leptospira ilyithenensis]|uniref:Type III restriction endonuclease subunit R n=1 Tax=Leptospira ilyithenensis TaxID=2484901 RepID=A0A4R9LNM3_9LEPT|nr:hypothetical protein [Leptospira ilyithenensis]TGN08989.1 hypothetical protein EHS11_13080 [Leptospira ilyithenensis]